MKNGHAKLRKRNPTKILGKKMFKLKMQNEWFKYQTDHREFQVYTDTI
jgi:hypothetical protein